jgi:citrate synthase
MGVVLATLAAVDETRLVTQGPVEHARARALVTRLTASLCLTRNPSYMDQSLIQSTIARSFLVAFGARPTPRAEAAVQTALVLMADHELTSSSFAARVAASTGADLYACVASALGAFSGPRHGGSCDQIEALVTEARTPERTRGVILGRTQRGEGLPGFGHPLYPAGDPRAPPLFDLAAALAPRNARVRTVQALVRNMARTLRLQPAADVGLVALVSALGLPPGSATALFALGRCAGWIAHALEQRTQGFGIRPRARYVGQ